LKVEPSHRVVSVALVYCEYDNASEILINDDAALLACLVCGFNKFWQRRRSRGQGEQQ
jgi:hypothetical protein